MGDRCDGTITAVQTRCAVRSYLRSLAAAEPLRFDVFSLAETKFLVLFLLVLFTPPARLARRSPRYLSSPPSLLNPRKLSAPWKRFDKTRKTDTLAPGQIVPLFGCLHFSFRAAWCTSSGLRAALCAAGLAAIVALE